MKKQDIYNWCEENNVPKSMIYNDGDNLWPIYNGEIMKGKRLVTPLSKPEERHRIVIASQLEEIGEEYVIEQPTQKKGTQSLDLFLPRLIKGYDVKPRDIFDLEKYVDQTEDYQHFAPTELITYDSDTKQIKTKDMNGVTKHYNHIKEVIYGDNLIKESDLLGITNQAVPKIIDKMLEILYRNNVSDYTKGLDVIVKLLACKNMDEKKYHKDGITTFQVIKNETDESFIQKLINLYVESTKELNNQVDEKYMCTQTSFYLIEVEDELQWQKNTKILKDLVEVIQRLKFVNVGNVDFVTQLFEELENNKTLKDYGIYITFSNLTNFITQSLPIKEYILTTKNPKLLYQDPAVGTGHFPNSFISEYTRTIENIKQEGIKMNTVAENNFINEFGSVDSVTQEYISNYVSGVDVQKRNIELCRLNTTLKNGEQIKCYHGNTLQKSTLRNKYPNESEFKDGKLDVVTSNFPFSVKGFSKDLNESDLKLYDLSKHVSDKSQQIENLFLEDTIQKLKEGGIAGFIIFESVLWKKIAINDRLRYKLLVDCELISVVKLGSEAFKNTSTKSVVLFIRKRKKEEKSGVKQIVDNFFKNYQKNDIIQEYVDEVLGIAFEEYVELLVSNTHKGKKGGEFIQREKDNLMVFLLNSSRKVVYVDLSFENLNDVSLTEKQNQEIRKKRQREFLGLSKSSYDEKKYQNSSYLPKLANSIKSIYMNNNEEFMINDATIEKIISLVGVIDFEENGGYAISFDGTSNDCLTENFEGVNFVNLGDIVQFHDKTKNRADDGIIGGQYPFFTCTSDDDVYKSTNSPDREGERILINNGGESYVRLTEEGSLWSASGDVIIMSSTHPIITNKFIFSFLKKNPKVLEWTYKGSGLKHSSIGRLKKIMVPLLDRETIENYVL